MGILQSLRATKDCQWDEVSLGEVMLRLDPGEGRVRTTRSFTAWEGGGEYNVARGLRRCFDLRTAIVTALVDNEIGRLLEDLMLQGGVNIDNIQWNFISAEIKWERDLHNPPSEFRYASC